MLRAACSISDKSTNSVVITGGIHTGRTVSRYGTTGHIEDLPSLNRKRFHHGCGVYTDDNGEQVIVTLHYTLRCTIIA